MTSPIITPEAIAAAARAMFCAASTNENPGQTWDEIVAMPQHVITVSFYRKQAFAALTAAAPHIAEECAKVVDAMPRFQNISPKHIRGTSPETVQALFTNRTFAGSLCLTCGKVNPAPIEKGEAK